MISVRVEAILSVWVFILLSGQHACSRDHKSYSQELIVQEVTCWTLKTRQKSCFTLWLSLFLLMLREECDLKKKHTGVCTKKDMKSLFFTASFKERKFFYSLHERFFFLTVCTHGYKLKCTVSYREKEQKPKSSFPTATPSVHPKAFSNMSLLGAKEAACIGL